MSESQSNIQINSKKLPKWCKILVLALPVIISFFQVRQLDNDFFFIHATGEYIVKHGIPYNDMLSMHSSMKIVVQQWLSSVIYYLCYKPFGEIGVLILLYLISFLIIFLTYRLISLITDNEAVSVFFTALINILVFDAFIVTRPQIFTYAILLAEICLLEKYIKTKKITNLIGIPVLSLLLINLHAAMWPMVLVFMVPYLISAVPLHTKSLNHEPTGDLLTLIAIFAVSIVVGLLNPYGFENMIYLTKSYGKDGLSAISEMTPTSWSANEGKTFIIVFAVVFLIIFFLKKKTFCVRLFLLFIGTLVLGLLQIKSIPYAILFGVPAFTYLLKDFDYTIIPKSLKNIVTKRIKVLICIFLCCSLVLICEGRLLATLDLKQSNTSHYVDLYGAVDYLNKVEEPIVLYANFNDGQFFEYYGYHPYIDGRAELFLASNNNEYDYFGEYLLTFNGTIYYKDFINKYKFNYLVLSKNVDRYLNSSLKHDDEFEVVYEESDVVLYKRVSD